MASASAAGPQDFESIRQTEIRKLDDVQPSPWTASVRSEKDAVSAFAEALKNASVKARAGDWLGAAEIFDSFPGESYDKRKPQNSDPCATPSASKEPPMRIER